MRFSRWAALALPLLCASAALAQQYVISTYAGGAPQATPVPGTAASIGLPRSVATDAAGNVYFTSDNCVFKLDTNGVLTRVAGNSRAGYSGDGGPATSAQLNPVGVAVDSAGNLYIPNGGFIRKVTPSGIISTVAGGGAVCIPSAPNDQSLGDGGPATSAQLGLAGSPGAVAVDSASNLYIADTSNGRIRRVTPAGIISTIAGNGTDSGDGGPALSAQLNPVGLAVDTAGNVYVAERQPNNAIRVLRPEGPTPP